MMNENACSDNDGKGLRAWRRIHFSEVICISEYDQDGNLIKRTYPEKKKSRQEARLS